MSDTEYSNSSITGIILAGGRGTRMAGADKGLVPLEGCPLIEFVIEALAPQVGGFVISANRNLDAYARYGWPVVEDAIAGYQGPLAGIASALAVVKTPFALVVPCDGPRPPADLARRLHAALDAGDAELAMAHDGERLHPLHSLLRTNLRERLLADVGRGELKVQQWMRARRHAVADFSDDPAAFDNLNSPDELAAWSGRRP